LYNVDTLALWSVTPTIPTADDLLRGPFDSILSAVNASIADPRILLDSVVVPNDGGDAIAKGIRDGTARAVSDGSFNLVTPDRSIRHVGTQYFRLCKMRMGWKL